MATRVVGTPYRPPVTAALGVFPGTVLDGEGVPTGIYLKADGLPASHQSTAMPAVKEELPDLHSTAILFTTTINLVFVGHFFDFKIHL